MCHVLIWRTGLSGNRFATSCFGRVISADSDPKIAIFEPIGHLPSPSPLDIPSSYFGEWIWRSGPGVAVEVSVRLPSECGAASKPENELQCSECLSLDISHIFSL